MPFYNLDLSLKVYIASFELPYITQQQYYDIYY